MRQWVLVLFITLGLIGPVRADDPNVGDVVRLVVRDAHIPAHPEPGDTHIAFRFTSGSTAEVLGIDAQSHWLQVKGSQEGDGEATGWITKTYIASVDSGGGGGIAGLPWCPPKGSPNPPHPGRIRIASWNVEALNAVDGQPTFGGSKPSPARQSIDYSRIKCYVREFDPDILALQELDGEAALNRVVDRDVYDIVVDQRPKPAGMNGKQNTGFAFKKGLNVQVRDDFKDLDTSHHGDLRYGARIDLTANGQTFMLMSVHLKSGCFDNSISGSDCTKLFEQIPVLKGWIDQAAQGPNPFIVLGDFNRRLDEPGDTVWGQIDTKQPPDADLTSITAEMPVSCRDNKFTEFIDHMLFDKRAIHFVDPSSFRQITYRQADKADWDKISDHCPVMVEMWVP